MKPTNSNEIRQAFLDYFEEMGHEVVPSSPLPVFDNPTLLFTNAGMNQFVDVFLGKEKRTYNRAASSQKCMRVQGKHNDLENVGPSPRHHTFFEMLGNFSFGDYFKEGAIRYAFDFITKVCEISAERLVYTVHHEDDVAYDIWVNQIGVSPEKVLRMGDKTNFWMMGDVGPCGPTSEIHYDWGPEHCSCQLPDCGVALDNDCNRWLEIWNLVFMQYNQAEDGGRTPLPKPGVDTGLGLERITAVVEGEPINYDTDLFVHAMDCIQELLEDSDEERLNHQTGYRVIADHGRAATFLIADGVLPGNVGRGYVLRMIIRRAARFGKDIGFTEPFLAHIAEVYIEQMGEHYGELERHREHIVHSLSLEEERFARTLDSALNQLDTVLDELHQNRLDTVPGEIAFNLYATHGLPLEITKDVANERGFKVDETGFHIARQEHAKASGSGAFGSYQTGDDVYSELLSELVNHGQLSPAGVDYDPYTSPQMESTILALVVDGKSVDRAMVGQSVEIVTTATPFYVEAGGEISDTGTILLENGLSEVRIVDVHQPIPGLITHIGKVTRGDIAVGYLAYLLVDDGRRWDIRRNHTATHLLHRELRQHLGSHVTQQGSLVAPDRLRFDFSHGSALDREQLSRIEEDINLAILANRPVIASHMKKKEAIDRGAMALFGEKYGEIVRTIRIGDEINPYSFELCGGLHVHATGDIGYFHFTSEEAVGAGIRRVEAVTGRQAQALIRRRLVLVDQLVDQVNVSPKELDQKVALILAENKRLQKEIARFRSAQAKQEFDELLGQIYKVDGIPVLAVQVDVSGIDGLREMADWFRDKVSSGVAVLATVSEGRVQFVVTVTEDLVKRGIKAGDIVGKLAKIVGGGGGGRPTLAQAGGRDPEKLPEALASVPEVVASAAS